MTCLFSGRNLQQYFPTWSPEKSETLLRGDGSVMKRIEFAVGTRKSFLKRPYCSCRQCVSRIRFSELGWMNLGHTRWTEVPHSGDPLIGERNTLPPFFFWENKFNSGVPYHTKPPCGSWGKRIIVRIDGNGQMWVLSVMDVTYRWS